MAEVTINTVENVIIYKNGVADAQFEIGQDNVVKLTDFNSYNNKGNPMNRDRFIVILRVITREAFENINSSVIQRYSKMKRWPKHYMPTEKVKMQLDKRLITHPFKETALVEAITECVATTKELEEITLCTETKQIKLVRNLSGVKMYIEYKGVTEEYGVYNVDFSEARTGEIKGIHTRELRHRISKMLNEKIECFAT